MITATVVKTDHVAIHPFRELVDRYISGIIVRNARRFFERFLSPRDVGVRRRHTPTATTTARVRRRARAFHSLCVCLARIRGSLSGMVASARDETRAREAEVKASSASAPASVEFVTDERTAGDVWRAGKYRDFLWRMRCAGVDGDPRFVEVLNAMGRETEALRAMSAAQRTSDDPGPWWRDGEYDEARAEDANDEGMRAMSTKAYVRAFDAFTEAIRLEPRRAVYHANRAAAGIALGRFEVAADDAQHAIERDDTYVKALVRAGTANLKIRRPAKALDMFRRALELDPTSVPAERGAREAERAFNASNQEAERQRDAARHGMRAALPRHDIDQDTAAEYLLSAEAALRANPALEGAKANVAEALVSCQRYESALEQCTKLLDDSLDRQYIVAETRWRMGDIDGALAEISSSSFRDSYDAFACKKCVALGGRLLHLQDLITRAEREVDDGQYTTAIRLLNTILEQPEGKMTTRFRGRVLRLRAESRFKSREYDAGEDDEDVNAYFAAIAADLSECLILNGKDFETFILRASLRTARGDYQGAFTDLRAAQTIAPTYVGIDVMVRDAAKRALRTDGTFTNGGPSNINMDGKSSTGGKFYDTLGIKPSASAREVKSAYRKLAAMWHPDKWTRCGDADAAAKAEEMFKTIHRAYATLSDAKQRRLYDCDPKRFDSVE